MSKNYIQKDITNLINNMNIPWEKLHNKTILITGGTGLIGQACIETLCIASTLLQLNLQVICLVRDISKAQKLFQKHTQILYFEYDLFTTIHLDYKIDYIIHGASITQSKKFIETPVDVLRSGFFSSDSILDLAEKKKVKSIVYLSSMEVYGSRNSNIPVSESTPLLLNTMSARSSYPVSKQVSETLCYAYFSQYKVPVKIARLTLTVGAQIDPNDSRVFAQFVKSVAKNTDLILHTTGETKRDYIYITDAVSAILTILLKGQSGESYNISNKDTYITIKEMAELIARKYDLQVIYNLQNTSSFGYATTTQINLNTEKLELLGWKAKISLQEMIEKSITAYKSIHS